jgi:ribosomal-protein-alanine N-acetyltransferase
MPAEEGRTKEGFVNNEIDKAYPSIETARLVLRALRMEDADFIFKEWGDAVVTYYMRDEEPLKTREQAEEMLRPLQTPEKMPGFKWWGIEFKVEGCLVGTCGYCTWDRQHHHAEIGYDLWPDYWGQGLMPEAIGALIRYGFEEMDLNRIQATTHTENQRSQRVLAKLGFQKEGVLREFYCRDGIYNDQVLFSLLRSEWQHTNAR